MTRDYSGPLIQQFSSLEAVQSLLQVGLPDFPYSFRFLSWQISLQMIPAASKSDEWHRLWAVFNDTYSELRKSFFNYPSFEDLPFLCNERICGTDMELLRRINMDLSRTTRQLRWILEDARFGTKDRHLRRLQRILYIFAKANPQNYIQGFHELLLPLYFVSFYGASEFELSFGESEAISYFMLHSLINGTPLSEFFTIEIYEGLNGMIFQNVSELLQKVQPSLSKSLSSNAVLPEMYAFSWATVMFSQIYDLPRLLHLWDFIFADFDALFKNLICLIVAHVISLKEKLLKKDFVGIMAVFHQLETMNEVVPLKICKTLRDAVHVSL